MRTIIVGDGLTKDILSLEHPYQTSKSNVVRREIERLMGKGKAFGDGPLKLRHNVLNLPYFESVG